MLLRFIGALSSSQELLLAGKRERNKRRQEGRARSGSAFCLAVVEVFLWFVVVVWLEKMVNGACFKLFAVWFSGCMKKREVVDLVGFEVVEANEGK
ncbi:hypothetical protein KY285_033315 [Solanum tuberosum]|nr:hypothetical protein KY285_033315 [Solanum tuberosum]